MTGRFLERSTLTLLSSWTVTVCGIPPTKEGKFGIKESVPVRQEETGAWIEKKQNKGPVLLVALTQTLISFRPVKINPLDTNSC